MDGGATDHVMKLDQARHLEDIGLLVIKFIEKGSITIEWGGGLKEDVVAMGISQGLVTNVNIVVNMHGARSS